MSDNPYLADVQVGDKLYNFLENNREYVVVHMSEEYKEILVRPSNLPQEIKDPSFLVFSITVDGAIESDWNIPHFLYAPVDVLDPKSLPPRPWKPKKGDWVWCRCPGDKAWNLRKFLGKEGNRYLLEKASGVGTISYDEIAPFKGELPPRLKEEDKSNSKNKP